MSINQSIDMSSIDQSIDKYYHDRPFHVSLREIGQRSAHAEGEMEDAFTRAPAQPSDLLPPYSTIIDSCTDISTIPPMNCQQVVVAHAHDIVQVQEGRGREAGR